MLIPNKLQPGDTVAITATSSAVNSTKLEAGIKVLESLGLKPYPLPSCYQNHGYLAGTDSQRLKDLHTAFKNKEIKGIFAARGGYGSARLLPYIDYDLIKNNPKIFVGFSDVTALHIAFNQICKLVTFHGPMPGANLGDDIHPVTLNSLKQNLFTPNIITKNAPPSGIIAPIVGGNLSMVCASLGTNFEIKTDRCILFLEEIDEAPYKVDRLFLQLKQAGKFKNVVGITLGSFFPETMESLKTAIDELILTENKPLITGIPIGHTSPTLTIPLGLPVDVSSLKTLMPQEVS